MASWLRSNRPLCAEISDARGRISEYVPIVDADICIFDEAFACEDLEQGRFPRYVDMSPRALRKMRWSTYLRLRRLRSFWIPKEAGGKYRKARVGWLHHESR